RVLALLVFGDALKPTAAAAIDALRVAGIRTVLLTGDQPEAALSVASRLGIDEWHASLLPADKLTQLARLRTNRAVVAGAAMAFSSVSVVANALRLRHWQAGLKPPG
ncbi:MAG: HAD family hydrolase, partial [Gammaproteobacteria bacterium]